ncbi:MAG: 3-dehydroquinate synthase [Chloroflexi bacterium]|nr:3-dehydroquinate synthase [Chloroflexota bacterium]
MQKTALILVGLSYTGKSVVGREIARRLGWPFVDTDDRAVALAGGKPIPEIFSEWGEARFRGLESQSLGLACGQGRAVIATGGGAVLDAGNRAMMAGAGVVVWLDAHPSAIYQRLLRDQEENPQPEVRPLLQGPDALERITVLKEQRLPYYSAVADWVVPTDALTVEEVAEEVLRAYGRLRGRLGSPSLGVPDLEEPAEAPHGPHTGGLPPASGGAAAVVATAGGSYPIFVGAGALNTLASRMSNLGLKGTTYLVSDDRVYAHHGGRVEELLRRGEFSVSSYVIPAGEASKSLETALALYDWLVSQRAERGHVIVALGGGVVGDLAGFVAATYLRGMPYVQAPTTLLAMVDASIGGKTGVNRREAKNLVGSFYQPRLVLADINLLKTLGQRELTEGWAEVLKHALIRDLPLLEAMEGNAEQLTALQPGITARVVAASAAIKAEVVSQDERETGLRALLNYGHTIGHGLEAATEYGGFLHGEAVAVGMMGAARISQGMGLLSEEEMERQRALLQRFGLPTRCPGVDLEAVRAAMALDKKVRDQQQRWVLLARLGEPVLRDDVPAALVEETLRELAEA